MHYWTRGQWPRAFTRGSLTSRLVADSQCWKMRSRPRSSRRGDRAWRNDDGGQGAGNSTARPRVLIFFAASSGVERHDVQAPNNPVGLPTGSHLSACTRVVARDGIGPQHLFWTIRAWGLCFESVFAMRIAPLVRGCQGAASRLRSYRQHPFRPVELNVSR